MERSVGALGAAAAMVASGVVGIGAPADAATTVTTSGTTMTVSAAGTETIAISCVGGASTINGKTGTPSVPCSALTKVTVNGDSGPQNVDGRELEVAAFAAKPVLAANLGAGVDLVWDTTRADQIDLGPGDDNYYPVRGVDNATTDMGADVDTIRFFGTDANETITGSSTNSVLTFHHDLGGVVRTLTMSNGEDLQVTARNGTNTVDLSGITVTSTIKEASAYAGDGNDVVRAPQFTGAQYADGATLFPGAGKNTVYGGTGNDSVFSEGNDDVISLGAGYNRVYDRTSPRSGRTIASGGQDNWYFLESNLGDATVRIRPGSGTNAVVTSSLNRPGQQPLTTDYDNTVVYLGYSGGDSRGLLDLVALSNGRDVVLDGDQADNDLADITIPTGSWTVSGDSKTGAWVTPAAPGYDPINVRDVGSLSVHGPWTNKNAGFVHRATRDLMFRFATSATISNTAQALGDGATTRPQVISGLMDSDEYRQLEVDRIFTRYLDRKADPAGMTYWTKTIKSGRELWRFRAQLFGSNEYFNKSGADNAKYLDAVYKDVLGRLPDPSGRAYWTGKLDGGADRGSVALQFINAAEFRRYIVEDQHLRFLDRRPTTAETDAGVALLKSSSTGEQQLIAGLAASNEYYNRT